MSTMTPYRVTLTNESGTLTWGYDTPAGAEGHYLRLAEEAKHGDTITIEMLREDGETYIQPPWHMETSVTFTEADFANTPAQ